jgi:hypothetical protein
MWRDDGALVVRADPLRAVTFAGGFLALGLGAIAAGHALVGAAFAAFGLIVGAYLLMSSPRLIVAERGVVLWGVELPWDEISDVYIRRDEDLGAFNASSRTYLVFRLARPELLDHQTDRASRRLAKAAAKREGIAVPLQLVNVPWEVAVEVVERYRPVRDWSESEGEKRLAAAARGEWPPAR